MVSDWTVRVEFQLCTSCFRFEQDSLLSLTATSLDNPAFLNPTQRTGLVGLAALASFFCFTSGGRVRGPCDFLSVTAGWLVMCLVWILFLVILLRWKSLDVAALLWRPLYDIPGPDSFLWWRIWNLKRGNWRTGSHWSSNFWYTTCGFFIALVALNMILAS